MAIHIRNYEIVLGFVIILNKQKRINQIYQYSGGELEFVNRKTHPVG